eukprot:SAG31_NODE_1408_length_8473_cov_2.276809_4_plen_47_part_00
MVRPYPGTAIWARTEILARLETLDLRIVLMKQLLDLLVLNLVPVGS